MKYKSDDWKTIAQAWMDDPNQKVYMWDNYYNIIQTQIKYISSEGFGVWNDDKDDISWYFKVSLKDPRTQKLSPYYYVGEWGAFWDKDQKLWVHGILTNVFKNTIGTPYQCDEYEWYAHFRPATILPLNFKDWPKDGIEFGLKDVK